MSAVPDQLGDRVRSRVRSPLESPTRRWMFSASDWRVNRGFWHLFRFEERRND